MRQLLFAALLCCSAPSLQAQLEPRDSPERFPHACRFESGVVGVDYLRRSLPTPIGTQLIRGTLIFEIAVYPKAGREMQFDLNDFELDWKRAERVHGPVHPQFVVASLMRPEYSGGPTFIADAGTIDTRTGEYEGVRVGGPPQHRRFPGDPRQTQPLPESIPADPRLKPSAPHPDALPSSIIPRHSLSAQSIDHPSAGYVYFDYNGKLTKLHQLKLKIRQRHETCEMLIRK